MAVKEKIKKLLDQLNTGIYEKKEVMALALLSSIAGESIFLLGPPGVAKSLIARRLKYAYKDAKVFEYLMSRFSTPDEIFGPVSISELKTDKYVRIIDNYLPDAEVVFLDEIWKAGPSIQNALLTILNEKKFRNGKKKDEKEITIERDVHIKALISASNELPAKDQGLEALWDRFLVRFVVEGIRYDNNFKEMIEMPSLSSKDEDANLREMITETISDDDYKKWSKAINDIGIPENVFNVIQVIRSKIGLHNQDEENTEKQVYASDRRWRKILRLMRTSAFLNDRKEVDLMDCFLIMHCIWNEEEQKNIVWQFVSEAVEKYGYTKEIDFKNISDELINFKTEIDKDTKYFKDTRVPELESVYKDYYEILNPLSSNTALIKQVDYKKLSNQVESIYLNYWYDYYAQIRPDTDPYNVRKGNSESSIFINDTEYKLKTTTQGEKRQITRRPNEYTEIAWDERAKVFFQHTSDMRNQIEQFRHKDLEHLRTNLFVDPSLANIVEAHITATQKEIDKIELEIREIQNSYKKLKNEEVVLDD